MAIGQPIRTISGTVDQVFSHRYEIPPDAFLELRIFDDVSEDDDPFGDFGGKSVADVIREIGFVEGLPSDLSTNPRYMEGFGQLKNQGSNGDDSL